MADRTFTLNTAPICPLAILRTCRQLHFEAMRILWANGAHYVVQDFNFAELVHLHHGNTRNTMSSLTEGHIELLRRSINRASLAFTKSITINYFLPDETILKCLYLRTRMHNTLLVPRITFIPRGRFLTRAPLPDRILSFLLSIAAEVAGHLKNLEQVNVECGVERTAWRRREWQAVCKSPDESRDTYVQRISKFVMDFVTTAEGESLASILGGNDRLKRVIKMRLYKMDGHREVQVDAGWPVDLEDWDDDAFGEGISRAMETCHLGIAF